MNRLIHAEFRRMLTLATWRWGPLAAMLCGGGFVALFTLVGPENLEPAMPGIGTANGALIPLGMVGLTAIVPALFGATAVTSEYRHHTISVTFLYVPNRSRVLAAKLLAYTIAGAVYGLVLAVSAGAALYGGAAVRGIEVGADPMIVGRVLLSLLAAMTVYTVIGVGVGALMRNQTATLIVMGAYLYMVEHSLAIMPGFQLLYPYLPGGATASLTDFTLLGQAATEIGGTPTMLLSPVMGAVILAGYAMAAAGFAVLAPMRRDIT